ncbi:hypothetical protein KFE25_013285 [Diacronema lutheri]|uniref:Uncharacterized protein n=2 Tax=Diacronema lutheri TaxID=2081491 RepID=A0A8J6CB06_DIALT|nr:hypothetical protein KFE25_013285 [Diacronema lutheri]
MAADPSEGQDLVEVLEFLFGAKIAPTDAFALAKAFVEAGVKSRAALDALTPERAKELTPAALRRKVVSALKRLPQQQQQRQQQAKRKQRQSQDEEAADGLLAKRARMSPLAPEPPPPADGEAPPASVRANRSPVMILWAAAVAQALGYDWSEALSLASAVASLFADAKGSRLGITSTVRPPLPPEALRDASRPALLGEQVPAVRTADGWRGLEPRVAGGYQEVHPLYVHRRLEGAFAGSAYAHVRASMDSLARAVPSVRLREGGNRIGYALYAQFRPQVSDGRRGWGEHGTLELAAIDALRAQFAPHADTGPWASAPPSPPTVQRAFAAIRAAGPAGAPIDAVAAALRCSVACALALVEELQLDGCVWQPPDGRGAYLPL